MFITLLIKPLKNGMSLGNAKDPIGELDRS